MRGVKKEVFSLKRVLRRSTLILIFTIAFIGGISYFSVELVMNADDWVDQPYNAHISGNGGLEQAGTIIDRNGAVLAQTVDGERVYNESYSVRTGLLHVVGDNSLNISTAVQSKYRSQLTGYNLLWGLNMPKSLRNSHDIKLTVDAETCAVAYDALSSYGKKGACVIYNYETGEVICSVSTFAYDPQAPPEITEENESEYDGVYLDNVISSSYTPGSIFKLITAAAAIENLPDIFERSWYCEGSEDIGGSDITCVDPHGSVDFKEAMAHSCNIVFAELAVELGADKLTVAAEKAGINSSFEVDDVGTAKGYFDISGATKNQLAWSGVGQYEDRVNPMQMAILCGAIANGGKAAIPTYIKDGSADLLKLLGINNKSKTTNELFKPETAAKLDEIMRYTITDYYGDYLFGDLSVCAKTGTAEVGENKEPTAWMVGYSQDEDCPLAFACVVEESGFGFTYAGPVAEAAMIQAAANLRANG